jgi:hypothetical protein
MALSLLARSALRQSRRSSSASSATAVVVRSMSSTSPWTDFAMAPLDPIIGLNEQFQKDDFPNKVIVGVGAYRDDQGKPYVLPCVREAEDILRSKNLDMEYAGIVSSVLQLSCLFLPIKYWIIDFDTNSSSICFCLHRPVNKNLSIWL